MAAARRNSEGKPMRPCFIVQFYGPEQARDNENRTLDEIATWGDEKLEYQHDYIQFLFPLPERSPINPSAPIIRADTRAAFLASADLRKRLFGAFYRMANFYGFDVAGDETDPKLTPMPDFKKQARHTWLRSMDHNHLRISRIIRCLRVLGLETVAQAFHKALKENADGVSGRSLKFWDRAVQRPLYLAPDDNDNASGIAWLKDDAQA